MTKLLLFAFTLGFGTTVAEPALIAFASLTPMIFVMAYAQLSEWRTRRARGRGGYSDDSTWREEIQCISN